MGFGVLGFDAKGLEIRMVSGFTASGLGLGIVV